MIIAQAWRGALLARGRRRSGATRRRLGPLSLIALLATLVLLFAYPGEQILAQGPIIVMLAVPIQDWRSDAPTFGNVSGRLDGTRTVVSDYL